MKIPKVMSKEDFLTEMTRIALMDGIEERHSLADALLCSVLRQLGYSKGIDIFDEMTKWYA